MTTVDRLFYKGLLNRKKIARRFVYWSRLSRRIWKRCWTRMSWPTSYPGQKHSCEFILLSLFRAIKCKNPGLLEKLQSALVVSTPPFESIPMVRDHARPARVSATTILSISSVPAGADIELDKTFAGETPSFITIAAGRHSIRITKRGYKVWERTLIARSGTVSLAADLEQEPGAGRKMG